MAQRRQKLIKWLAKPERHDYPAALSYLCLTYEEDVAQRIVKRLRRAKVMEFKAKDIFRASQLSLLGISNLHVQRDKLKIERGEPLAPLLLVRLPRIGRVMIADGYHRLCAVYTFDEDAMIPCKIV